MLAAATDVLLVAAWVVVVLPGLRSPAPRAPADPAPRLARRLLFLAGLVVAIWLLDREGGRLTPPSAAGTIVGLGLAAAGVVLHHRACGALGGAFTTRVAVPPDRHVVRDGPYACVRHPIYLAILLVAAGTSVAHPSAATGCLAVGLALGMAIKIRREEQLLARALGTEWAAYAARVPRLVPRLRCAAPR